MVGEGGAEIAAEQHPQIVEVLEDQGPVIPGIVDALLQLRRRQLAAERGRDGVAGGPHQEEDERDEDEDRRDDEERADQEVTAEAAS